MKCALIFAVISCALDPSESTLDCDEEFRCHDDLMNTKLNQQIAVGLQGHYTYFYMAQLFQHHDMNYPKVAQFFRSKAAKKLSHAERFIQLQNQRGGKVEMYGVNIYNGGECARAKVTNVKQAFRCSMEMEARITRWLTQLHQDASELTYAIGDATECDVPAINADDLRLTQPILVTVAKTKGGREITEMISYYKQCGCGAGETNCRVVSFSYPELADRITYEFLGQQLAETKEIANHYNTLKKMYGNKDNAPLESWLFDHRLDL